MNTSPRLSARRKRLLETMREMIAREAKDAEDAEELAHEIGYYLQMTTNWGSRKNLGNPNMLPNTEQVIEQQRQQRFVVKNALSRARRFNVEASLTQREWMEIVDHFENACAYCKGPYQVLEHFVPLPYGGTTANNCIPACYSCNIRKGHILPGDLHSRFPQQVLDRISSYLQSL